MTTRNVTMVLLDSKELEYIVYWCTVFNSDLPFFDKPKGYLKNILQVEEWKVSMFDLCTYLFAFTKQHKEPHC